MSQNNDEVLVRVEGVSKKFCRSLKKSLWYGVCDIAGELLPVGKRRGARDEGREVSDRSAQDSSRSTHDTGLSTSAASSCDARLLDSGRSTAAASQALDASSPALDSGLSPLDSAEGLRPGEFFAVKDVSFELRRGECLGLIGHNGAGKTTLLKMLNGLIKPDAGSITMRGRVGALIALGAGFNPILTGRENIYVNGSVLGLSKKEIDAKIDEIIDFAEIREFIDMSVQSYSSGMAVRLGFSVATAMNPDVLILDEVLAVGDASFRARCFERIGKNLSRAAVIFVSHSEAQIQRICNKAIWLKNGEVIQCGEVQSILSAYRDDQNQRLIKNGEWVTGYGIQSIVVEEQFNQIRTADFAELTILVNCSEKICITNLYCQWHIAGTPVAQADFSKSPIENLVLKKGENKILLSIIGSYLAKGEYEFSVAAFSDGGKNTVFHNYCAAKFRIDGPLGVGPAAQFPSKVWIQ
jgi:lipopolysaccharide transport system ATP-binding protein